MRLQEAGDAVIWAATMLLALVAGLGGAFFLWMGLRDTASPVVAHAAVISIGFGVAVLGLTSRRPLALLACCLFACVLTLAYTLGGPEFARLIS